MLAFFPWRCLWAHAHEELHWFSWRSVWQCSQRLMENGNTLVAALLEGHCQQSKSAMGTGALLFIALPVATNGAEEMQTSLRGAHPSVKSLIEIKVKFIDRRVKFCPGCIRAFFSPFQATAVWFYYNHTVYFCSSDSTTSEVSGRAMLIWTCIEAQWWLLIFISNGITQRLKHYSELQIASFISRF